MSPGYRSWGPIVATHANAATPAHTTTATTSPANTMSSSMACMLRARRAQRQTQTVGSRV